MADSGAYIGHGSRYTTSALGLDHKDARYYWKDAIYSEFLQDIFVNGENFCQEFCE